MKTFKEFVNEKKDLDNMIDDIGYAMHKNSKLPKWQDMVEYLKSLGGIEVDMHKGGIYYDTKIPGRTYVADRHETQGFYVEVKDKKTNRKILNDHSSSKNLK